MNLAGSHVVVTGGSRGIGLATATAFAARGATVTVVARDSAALRMTASAPGLRHLAADLRDPTDFVERLERLAPVDVLVNNAGVVSVGDVDRLSADQLRDQYLINALAPAELSRQLAPIMVGRGHGRLVFVSSLSAQVSTPGLTAYAASKAALSRFAHGLRHELRTTGVGVTLAEIGTVATGMAEELMDYPPAAATLRRTIGTRATRLLTADEVARAVVQACVRDRGIVVLPRRARAQTALAHLPQRVADLLVNTRVS